MMQKGGVNMKVWDIGGQQQFRDEWPRYCKGVDTIVFVVDTSEVLQLLLFIGQISISGVFAH